MMLYGAYIVLSIVVTVIGFIQSLFSSHITIESVSVGALHSHLRIDSAEVSNIAEKIEQDNSLRPILVDKTTNVIIDGHHRYEAMKMLGYTSIWIVKVNILSPKITLLIRGRPGSKLQVLFRGLLEFPLPPHYTSVKGVPELDPMSCVTLKRL